MKLNGKERLAAAAEFLIFALGLTGLVMGLSRNGCGTFRFYTTDSNVFASLTGLIALISRLKNGGRLGEKARNLLYASACTVALTFLVVVFILTPMGEGKNGYFYGLWFYLTKGEMLYHHFLVPVLACVNTLFIEKPLSREKRLPRFALIPTVLYAAVTITLNILKKLDGPYPFLKVYDQNVLMSFVWAVVIFSLAYGICLCLRGRAVPEKAQA